MCEHEILPGFSFPLEKINARFAFSTRKIGSGLVFQLMSCEKELKTHASRNATKDEHRKHDKEETRVKHEQRRARGVRNSKQIVR